VLIKTVLPLKRDPEDCPLRPAVEMQELMDNSGGSLDMLRPQCEMNPDDMEIGGVSTEEADAGEDLAQDDADDEDELSPVAPRNFVVDLWPFAFGRDYYKYLLQGVFGASAMPAHFVYMTATAHPGAVLAAHDGKMHAHVILDRVREHSRAHGKELLRQTLEKEYYKAEKAKAMPKGKRWLSTELSFVRAVAPAHHGVVFSEVPQRADTPTWRAGLDQAPASHDLESAVPQIMTAELESLPLHLKDGDQGNKCLYASQGFREGDKVAACKCLLFSTARGVANFLNMEGNGALLEGPLIHVMGLDTGTDQKTEVFAVQLGLTMFIPDFRGKKGRPNVTLEVSPGEGANDGFLSFVVHTRNACGIAAGSPILCDFGESYRQTTGDPSCSAAKRFRGSLDLLVSKQWQALAGEGTEMAVDATVQDPDGVPRRTAGKPLVESESVADNDQEAAASSDKDPKAASSSQGAQPGILVTKSGYAVVVIGNRLGLRSSAAANFKISPKTILHNWIDGNIDKEEDTSLPLFKFEKPKELVIEYNTQLVMTIGDLIKKNSADKMYHHAPFAQGVPPTCFVAKDSMTRFKPKQLETVEHLRKAAACEKAQLLWSVVVSKGKLVPKGVALTTKGQIILKPGEDFEL